MVKAIFLVLLAALCAIDLAVGGECNSYDREKINEGYRKCVYRDSLGIPTIGVGFNLKKFGARTEIESVGADYDKVLAGSECLDDSQIEKLFNKDMSTAVSCASNFVSNYNSIGGGPQSALCDMAFNMGCATLSTFGRLRDNVEAKDYSAAVTDMQDSLWCRQVGERCDRDVKCMKEGILEQQKEENNIL